MDNTKTQTPTVLVVENNAEVLDLVAAMVVSLGWKALPAASIEEAHERLAGQPIDAVITDLVLGDGDGLALIRELSRQGGKDVPSVMISSYASPELRQTAQRAGAIDLLPKPFRMERLSGLLESAMRERGFTAQSQPESA